jgi:hypothetical protein
MVSGICLTYFLISVSYKFCFDTQEHLASTNVSRSCRALPLGKGPGVHWIGGWAGLRAGLDTEAGAKIFYLCLGSRTGRPVCSQTLYRLSEGLLMSRWGETMSV